ncbi:MAG: PPC domain-containing protein [Opitutaceae bacterium]|nr:PPC domain-containing protein [Opitutaceae bacterium]
MPSSRNWSRGAPVAASSQDAARAPHPQRLLATLLLTLTFTSALLAVAPNFASVTPAGGQRGTTVVLTLRGDRLADVQEIFFYDAGLAVESITETAERVVKARVRIAADCRLGEHALRLRTASGLSSLRLFYVGPLPSLDEKENNDTAAKAQPVPLGTTVHGIILAEDTDWFSVTARAGQRLSVEIEGARLGRTMFDPILTIRDAAGKIMATADDSPLLGHDGFASLLVPADGNYTIQVRDVVYAGNGHAYRLHIGTFPRPAAVFPLGGRPGEILAATFLGDPAGDFTQTLRLPEKAGARHGVIAERDGTAPSPNWVRVSDLPAVRDVKPASTAAQAPLLNQPAPFAFDGVLATKGEAAFLRFTAKKDQHLDFTIFARRLGSPLDSVLTVLGPKGNSLGSNDDSAGQPDSTVRVRIPEDGAYTVKIADQLGRSGPLHTFRLEIAEVRPALVLSVPDTARYDYETRKSPAVARGNRFAVLLNIARDGFNQDLRLAFDGLPPGITATSDLVPANLTSTIVLFEAAADAPIGGGLVRPRVIPAAANEAAPESRFRHNVEWVRIQNDTVYVRSEVDRMAAAVVEELPFKIAITEPKVPLVQGGEMALPITVERAAGFDEPITLKMILNPSGVSSQPEVVIPKGATSAIYKLNATARADIRTARIAVIGGAPVKGGTAFASSQLATLDVAAPFVIGKIDFTKVERGATARVVCTLDQKVPFEGTALARLIGLPDEVTAQPVEITKDSKQAVFELVTTAKAPLGLRKTLACSVTLMQGGEPIPHILAPGSMLRIDPPRAKPAAVAATKE